MDEEQFQENLGDHLRALREKRGLSQSEVAAYLGIGRSAYSYKETGKTGLSAVQILQLARLFRVSTDVLLMAGRWNRGDKRNP